MVVWPASVCEKVKPGSRNTLRCARTKIRMGLGQFTIIFSIVLKDLETVLAFEP